MVFNSLGTVQPIRSKIRDLFWSAPRSIIPFLIKFRFRRRFKNRIKIENTGTVLKLIEFEKSGEIKATICFYHPLRVTRYFDGIEHRIEKLLQEYCVNQINDLQSGVFIDVGSNVGEFSLGISKRYPKSKFIRFEPSYEENLASELNLSAVDDILIPKALWSEKTELFFYRRNESGDSSFFTPDNEENAIKIQTTTLDDEVEKYYSGEIQLLKLEAEGAEPEILLGGEKTLERCRYVCADLGPERGITKGETFEDSNRILNENGFFLVGRNAGSRKCFLYKNGRH